MRRTPYSLTLESRVSGGPRKYRFHTADGVCSKRSFRAGELQLLEFLWDTDLGHFLCPEANYGVVGTVLSETADSVQMTDSSARAARLCESNVRKNSADAAVALLADYAALNRRFDTVAYAPKSYTALPIGKQRVVDALSVLRADGSLYLAASKRSGLTRYEDYLRGVAATVERVAESGEYRLLEATRPRTFETPSSVSPRRIHPTVNDVELSLVTVPGLFSTSGVDDGTRLLAENATVEDGDRVLDLCCGYGAIGAYAGRVADCEIWLSDDDEIATRCAECSLRASHVDGTVVTADCVEGVVDQTFDRILCNPPTHAGDGVLSELFSGAYDVLASDGQLDVVHHRELDLREHFAHFGEIERAHEGEEHVVLKAIP